MQTIGGFAQRLLHPFAFGDVLYRAEHADGPARLVVHDFVADLNKSHVSTGANDPVFDVIRPASLYRFGHRVFSEVPVIGMDHLSKLSLTEGAIGRRQPQDAASLFRPPDAIGDKIALPVADVRKPFGLMQLVIAFAQGLLRPPLISYVAANSENMGAALKPNE